MLLLNLVQSLTVLAFCAQWMGLAAYYHVVDKNHVIDKGCLGLLTIRVA